MYGFGSLKERSSHHTSTPFAGVISILLLTGSVVVLLLPGVSADLSWEVGIVDGGNQGSFPSIAVDSLDRAHISYHDLTVKGLKYIRWDGAEWRKEIVDVEGQVGQYTSLALDSSDLPHIAYYDYGTANLKYARWDGLDWQVEVVDSATDMGKYASLALDSTSRPHIVYYDGTDGDLRYANWDGVNWNIVTVESSGVVGTYASIAVDSLDRPHVSYYYGETNGHLRYANWNGSAWNAEAVDFSGPSTGKYSSIALDSLDRPHVSYYRWGGEDLRYAHWDGNTWVLQTVHTGGFMGQYTSIALDSLDRPHISYTEGVLNRLYYATWTGSVWDKLQLDSGVSGFTSISIDSGDAPHIAYHYRTHKLVYANCSTGPWVSEILDGQNAYVEISLALDSGGTPHVSYLSGKGLAHAYWTGDTWISEVACTPDHLSGAVHSSLALDSSDRPHISYAEDPAMMGYFDLKYVWWDGSSWIDSTVDTTDDSGRFNSIAMDSLDMPHIAYRHSALDSRVRYASWTGSAWDIKTVEAGQVGDYISLALDSLDAPHLAYYDYVSDDLKYAYWDGLAWVIQTVDSPGNVGQHASLALDSLDRPHISYYDVTNGNLKYAFWDGSGWVIEIADSTGDVGRFTSIDIDSVGRAHIAYYDATNTRLKHAAKWTGFWRTETVDPDPATGSWTSLEVSSSDRIHIAYFDGGTGAVRHASSGFPAPPFPQLLQVQGYSSQPGILHVTDHTPVFTWVFSDPDAGDIQYAHNASVWSGPDGTGTLLWWCNLSQPATSIEYDVTCGGGAPLTDGSSYYLRIKVRDSYGYWSQWNETMFRMNTPPPYPVEPIDPPPGAMIPSSDSQMVSWTSGGPDSEGDLVTYYWEIALDSGFGAIATSGSTTNTNSTTFITAPGTVYYWRVRADDSWEISAYGNAPTGYWSFSTTNTRPGAPDWLGVEGYVSPPEIMHITNHTPVLNWTFSDPDMGDVQTQYNATVWDGSGLQLLWWCNITSGDSSATYNVTCPDGPVLLDGDSYRFRIRTSDSLGEWSPANETLLRLNTPPPSPVSVAPIDGQTLAPSTSQFLEWAVSIDPEGDSVVYHWQVADDSSFSPGSIVGEGDSSVGNSTAIATEPCLTYFWRVKANDSWEESDYGNQPIGYWQFHTSCLPDYPRQLAVEGFLGGSTDILRITNHNPTLSWNFSDPDSGDFQSAYNATVYDQSHTTILWSCNLTGSEESVTYGITCLGGTELLDGQDYWFAVKTRDSYNLWGDWNETLFHVNALPSIPVLLAPSNGSKLAPSTTQTLTWTSVVDPEGYPVQYIYEVDDTESFIPPLKSSGTLSGTISNSFETFEGDRYYWHVRSYDGVEYSPWSETWSFSVDISPLAPKGLGVDGFLALTDEIGHILTDNPDLNWTFADPDDDVQTEFDVEIWTNPGGTGILMWAFSAVSTIEQVAYNADGTATLLEEGETYYFRVRTEDDYLWSGWSEVEFHVNAAPPVPVALTPNDGEILPPVTAQTVTWSEVTDADGDVLSYYFEVGLDAPLGPPYVTSGTVAGTASESFQTIAGECYYWHVRSLDGWETSDFTVTWSFCADSAPDDPIYLAVEGFRDAPEITHITTLAPELNWTFADPDGDVQSAFDIEVWTEAGGFGMLMWSTGEVPDYTTIVTYGYFGSPVSLQEGEDYCFRVRTKDDFLWSGWSELMFHMNAPPTAPSNPNPTDSAVNVPVDTILSWEEVQDPDGDSVEFWWYISQDPNVAAPYVGNGTTFGTASPSLSLGKETEYFWNVCAHDGWSETMSCSETWDFVTIANVPPTASISGTANTEEGQIAHFSGENSTDSDGSIAQYRFDFDGDGVWDTPWGDLPNASHTYEEPGTYTVILNVTDDDGDWDTHTMTIGISEKPAQEVGIGDWWWIIIVIVIVVSALAVFLAKRRKTGEGEEPVEEGTRREKN